MSKIVFDSRMLRNDSKTLGDDGIMLRDRLIIKSRGDCKEGETHYDQIWKCADNRLKACFIGPHRVPSEPVIYAADLCQWRQIGSRGCTFA